MTTERLIHSTKTAIAVGASYIIAAAIGQAADQWIVISVIVVMCAQIYVGSIMHKSYLRLLGTLMGCLMATLAILFLNQSFIGTLVTLVLAGFIFSFIATMHDSYNQMGTLGAVTTVIILFGTPPSLEFALMRFIEISAGILIAALISQFLFPIHARTHLRRAQASALGEIRDYYTNVVINRFNSNKRLDSSEQDEKIIKSLLKQRQLAKEAAPELMGKRFDPDHFAQTLYCEREILRAINFMDMALSKIESLRSIYQTESPLTSFNTAVIQALNALIHALKTNQLTNSHIHLPDLKPIIQSLHEHIIEFAPEQRIYLDGFVFSADILTTHLKELAILYQVPITAEPLPSS